MNKLIKFLLASLIFSTLYFLPASIYAQTPGLSVNFLAAKYDGVSSYTDSTTTSVGNRVVFYFEVTNNGGASANNVVLKTSLPGGAANSHTVTAEVTSSNAATATDPTTITITGTPGKLVFLNGTTQMTYHDGASRVTNNQSDNVISSGITLPVSLQPGSTYGVQLTFQTDVAVEGSSPQSSSSPSPAVCSDTKPARINLKSAQKVSGSSVKLVWDKATNANNYSISFGTKSGSYQYGVPSTGNTSEFTINSLEANKSYYFVVTPINNCMPGDKSNELSTLASQGQSLQPSTIGSADEVLGEGQDLIDQEAASTSLPEEATATALPQTESTDNQPSSISKTAGEKLKELAFAVIGLSVFASAGYFINKNLKG